MRSLNILGAVALLAVPAVSLDEDYDMSMPCFNDICWTSWKCVYSRMSKYESTIGDKCGLPDNVYTPGPDGTNWPTLVWGQQYRMEWTSRYDSQGEDIVLEWLMWMAPGTEEPIPANETDMYWDYRGEGPERFIVAHTQNIRKSILGWYFQPNLSFFPNDNLNVSSLEVTAYAMERNAFRLYNPKTFDPHNSTTWDVSVPFSVIRPEEQRMVNRAKYNQRKSDNKRLGLGVGLGVGLSLIVAYLVAWYTSAWNERRKLSKRSVALE